MRIRKSQRTPFARRDRNGAAVVELAVVAPLFLLLLAGIVEFGQAFRIEHTLANAAHRGARSAIVDGATRGQVYEKVKTQCGQILGVGSDDVTVALTVNGSTGTALSDTAAGDEVSVTVSIAYDKAGVGFFTNMFSSSVFSSTSTFEHE